MDNIHKCIYMLISPSKKVYVGKTTNLKSRFKDHRNVNGKCPYLHNAIRKYGWENFLKIIIEIFEDNATNDFMNEREIYWIKEHEAYGQKGYNLTTGGDGKTGYVATPETRKRISAARIKSDYVMSAQGRARMSQAKIGNKINLGRIHREETKTKISRGNKLFYEKLSGEEKRKRNNVCYRNARKRMKPVVATEKKTGIKRNFESVKTAARTLTNENNLKFHAGAVSNCCNKKQKKHKGWTFEFVT